MLKPPISAINISRYLLYFDFFLVLYYGGGWLPGLDLAISIHQSSEGRWWFSYANWLRGSPDTEGRLFEGYSDEDYDFDDERDEPIPIRMGLVQMMKTLRIVSLHYYLWKFPLNVNLKNIKYGHTNIFLLFQNHLLNSTYWLEFNMPPLLVQLRHSDTRRLIWWARHRLQSFK